MSKFLLHTDIPMWYDFYWDRVTNEMKIKVHKIFIKNNPFNDRTPYFKGIKNDPGFLPLLMKCEPVLGKPTFGVDNAITLCDEDESWLTYKINIPKVNVKTGQTCLRCSGTGKYNLEGGQKDEVCSDCDGDKMQHEMDWTTLSHVCLSLNAFLSAVEFPLQDIEMLIPRFQALTLRTVYGVGAHSHSTGGLFSPYFLQFLTSISNDYDDLRSIDSAVAVMKNVHTTMFGKLKSYYQHDFRVWVRNAQICIHCPGDACELHTNGDRRVDTEHGAELFCHNLDTGTQQLTLLAGLAEVVSLYRQTMGWG
jgi:hypothetical protein